MILIITHKQDFTADFLIDKLNRKKIPYIRLNCEDLLLEPEYAISDLENFSLRLIHNIQITAVWFRRTQVPSMNNLTPNERLYFNKEFDLLLDNIYHSLSNCKWISNPFNIRIAESKILQLKKAKELGLTIPKTLITNSKEKLVSFYKSNKKTVLKPIYSGYVPNGDTASLLFTSIITDELISKLPEFDLTPCIYQEYIEKDYEVRLTIIDNKIFCAKVDSQLTQETMVDWRKKKLSFIECEIPVEISDKCILLCKRLGINFGAIDLIKDINGEYVFLEINPNGQWAWIEMETGLNISENIIKYLTN